MEESISTFCKSLGSFCDHLQTSCDALKESINRRPIPLDSASSSFIQSLNRRVSTVSGDLNLLDSMVIDTVSFEELLGHCNEVYKKNQNELAELEDHLRKFGYLPRLVEDELDLDPESFVSGSIFAANSIKKSLEDDPLLENPVCLQDLGLSDACLATLASEANDELASPTMSFQKSMSCYELDDALHEKEVDQLIPTEVLNMTRAMEQCHLDSAGKPSHEEVSEPIIKTTKDDYDKLPSFLRNLASWEDLQEAVEKMNSNLPRLENQKGNNLYSQEELASLGLGKSHMLLLVRLNQLVVEASGTAVVYRIVSSS